MKCCKKFFRLFLLLIIPIGILAFASVANAQPVLNFDGPSFRQAFNNSGKKLETTIRITTVSYQSGSVRNSMKANLNSAILSMIGSLEKKSKKLSSVTLIIAPNGDDDNVIEMVLGMGQLIATIDPKLSPEQRGQLIRDMGFYDSGLKPGSGGEKKLGKNKFFYAVIEGAGIWFGVEAIK